MTSKSKTSVRKRKFLARMKCRLSSSSFLENVDAATSTPVTKSRKVLKKKKNAVGGVKRKLNNSKSTGTYDNERTQPQKKMKVVDKDQPTEEGNRDLGYLFRNDHCVSSAVESDSYLTNVASLPLSRVAQEEAELIDLASDTVSIKDVGETFLHLVDDAKGNNDDSNRTIPTTEKEISTVVIDDSTEDVIVIDDDEEEDKECSVQEIAVKYADSAPPVSQPPFFIDTQPTTTNFIPLKVPLSSSKKKRVPYAGKNSAFAEINRDGIPSDSNSLTHKKRIGRGHRRLLTGWQTEGAEQKKTKRHETNEASSNVQGKPSQPPEKQLTEPRPIVIDGSNVAMVHGKHSEFSLKGIEIVIDKFKEWGHKEIVAFLPEFRRKVDPEKIANMEKTGNLVLTPSRRVENVQVTSYDDRFIVEHAANTGGIIVSRDNFRDLLSEKEEWREAITKRLLMPTFVGDRIMFPDDPLGRHGPRLNEFLRF